MKLQLDEKTLNAYINKAIRQELFENNTDELFGSRRRKESKRMITGQGWGNQKRDQANFWGSANTDISNTDADEEVPQTLVGMIKKMEQGLVSIEQTAGLPGEYEGLAEKVAAYRNGGGFKMKQSLLNAINALSRLADRLNAVEQQSGSNAIMESAGDYADAAVGGNAAVGNARNMANLGRLQGAARSASAKQGAATRAINTAAKNPSKYAGMGPQLSANYQNAVKANTAAKDAMAASNIGRNTGFWGKQVANMKNGAQTIKGGVQTIKGAKNTGNAVQAGVQAYHAATEAGKTAAQASKAAKSAIRGTKAAGQVLKGAGQVAKGVGQITQIPLLLLSIADEAARQGAEARQRKIVRTYNCAAVLAKRMANIAQEIANAQGGQQQQSQPEEQDQLAEINVKKSRSFFDSIENGMNELSALMKQIYGQLHSANVEDVQMPASLNSPEEIEQFQNWANARGYKDENGAELVPDGKWGPHTDYAYNQAAQTLQQSQNQGTGQTINESAVGQALKNLENKVGVTGAGGQAYADISRMSGARDGSRSQGARAAKFIIRSYPPVLNQYLTVLGQAGANVNGIQPLRERNGQGGDYDWQEVQLIDNRIKQLLGIARNVENVRPLQDDTQVTLPPKPNWTPRPARQKQTQPQAAQNAPDVPELPELDTNIDIEEPEIELPDEELQDLDTSTPEVKQMAYKDPGTKENVARERKFVDNVIDVMRGMGRDNSASLKIKKMGISNAYKNALNAIDKMVGWGAMTNEQAKEEKKRLKYFYKEFKNGGRDAMFGQNWQDTFSPQATQQTAPATMSEQQFKNFVKRIINETLNK